MNAYDALVAYFTAWFRLVKNHVDLFLLEAKLFRISLWSYLITGIFIVVFLVGLWLSLLASIGFIVYSYAHNVWIACLSSLLLAGVATFVTFIVNFRIAKKLTFERTRAHWASFKHFKIEHADNEQTKKH
jgi:lysylphosphatidylglycerol synthetase-like protein (DUF2156 family)